MAYNIPIFMKKKLILFFMLLTITCYGQENGDYFKFSPYVNSFIANYKTKKHIKDIKKYTKQYEEVNIRFIKDEIYIALSVVNDENRNESEIVSSMLFNLKESEISFFKNKEDKTIQNIKIENSYASLIIGKNEDQKTILISDKSKNQIYSMVYKDSALDMLAIALGAFDSIAPEPKDFEKNFNLISNKLSRYNVKVFLLK